MWKPRPKSEGDGWRVHVYDRLTGNKVGAYDFPARDARALARRLDSPDGAAARAAAAQTQTNRNSAAHLVDRYQSMQCKAYAGLAQETRRNYDVYLKMIRAKFGAMEKKALEAPRVRLIFEAWRDEMAASPRMADMAVIVLNNVLDNAVREFEIAANHAKTIGRLYKGKDAARAWRPAEIARLRAAAPAHVAAMIDLALLTGARSCALRELSPANVRDGWLTYDPQKRGRMVRLPLAEWPALKRAIEALPKDGLRLLTNAHGKPWTREAWKSAIRRAINKAGLEGVTFHDFRVTAITGWARTLDPHQIAFLTGHSMRYVQQVLDRHYIERDDGNVIAAVKKVVSASRN